MASREISRPTTLEEARKLIPGFQVPREDREAREKLEAQEKGEAQEKDESKNSARRKRKKEDRSYWSSRI